MKKNYLFAFLVVFPTLALGFSLKDSTFSDVIMEIKGVIDILIPILSAVATIIFFWGLSKFILNSGNQADLEKGRSYMIWGILALFILMSYQTIVFLVAKDLDIGNGGALPIIKPISQ